MASFQAKIGWKMPRKRKSKNYRSVSFQPEEKQKIKKKQQINSKNERIPLRVHLKPKYDGKGREKQKIRIIVPFRSCLALNRKFKENSKKIQKIKKHHYGFISRKRRLEKDVKE